MANKKHHGLIFSAAMVKAMLMGNKTQTRRIGPRYSAWKPGDLIHVRETWATIASLDSKPPKAFTVSADRPVLPVWYRADEEMARPAQNQRQTRQFKRGRWRAAMHMPRWAGRIRLEISEIRQEPLQALSEADARAEGVVSRDVYRALWEQLHGPDSWESNPAVWVISFGLVKPGNSYPSPTDTPEIYRIASPA